jgi:GntR family phosphonate transport system transcriptional regulator
MGEIERRSGIALWHQIEERLAEEIDRGAYASDVALPTEAALSQRFGVNRHTIRRAIAGLANRGLLRVEQGRGMFLADHAIDYALGPRTRFSENLLQQGRQPAHEILRLIEVPAPPEAMRALGLTAHAATLLMEGVSSADGRPISLSTTYFPTARLPGIAAALRQHVSITAALGSIGFGDYRRRSTRVTARPASEEERQRLRLLEGRPLLVTESINVDQADRPITYGIARFAADRVQLVLET